MKAIPLIRQHHFGHIASTLDAMNVDVGRVLCRSGIPEWQHCEPTDQIPLIHFIRAFEVGAHAVGDERFGVVVVERNGLEKFASFGKAVRQSLTVYDALRTSCRLATSEATTLRFWLRRTENGVLFCRKQLVATPDIQSALIHLERYTMSVFVEIVRLGAGPNWRPTQAYLSGPKSAGASNWGAFEDTEIHFEAPFSAIYVPDHILCLPLSVEGNATAESANSVGSHLEEVWNEQDLTSTLRSALRTLLKQNCATIEAVADISGISKRTMQRRLAAEGVLFREVLEQARYQEATRYLKNSDNAIAEISDFVGYEHPQHFIRAFRRWAGVTPGRYRTSL